MKKNGDSLSILGFGAMRLAQKDQKIDEERAARLSVLPLTMVNEHKQNFWGQIGSVTLLRSVFPFLLKVITKPDVRRLVE